MSYNRQDGRSQSEVRSIAISFDRLARVDGSARFGFGSTKAVASVSGPIEVRLAQEQASKATFEVIVRPLAGVPATDCKALASSLRAALLPSVLLTHNPRTLIQLVAQSLSPPPLPTSLQSNPSPLRSSPSLTAALINASTLALLNTASFPLLGVVCAASIGRVRDSHTLVVDPSDDELPSLDGGGTFAFLFSSSASSEPDAEAAVWSSWNAVPFTEEELMEAIALARQASGKVWQCMKQAISASLTGQFIYEHSSATQMLSDTKMEIS